MLVVLLGVGTLTACSTSGGELSARDQEIREVSMGSDCVIAFLDESDAEGLYPATEEDPLAGTDTQFRDGGDAATVTGSMLMQSLEGRIVEGAYTCEATLSDAGDVMPVWDLDVTTTWEQPAVGAVPTYPSGFVHSVDRALESWLWLRDPGTVVPGGRMEISGSDVVCSAGFLAERDGRTTLLTATLCGAPDTQLTVDEPIGTVVGAAAVLPCFWLYAEIGFELTGDNHPEHPYHAWLQTYSGEFQKIVEDAVEKILYANADVDATMAQLQKDLEAFVASKK